MPNSLGCDWVWACWPPGSLFLTGLTRLFCQFDPAFQFVLLFNGSALLESNRLPSIFLTFKTLIFPSNFYPYNISSLARL